MNRDDIERGIRFAHSFLDEDRDIPNCLQCLEKVQHAARAADKAAYELMTALQKKLKPRKAKP